MIKSGFFNSKNKDRRYTAEDFGGLFDGLITEGVYAHIGKTFAQRPGEGLSIIVSPGKGWFMGTWITSDADEIYEFDTAETILNRIDSLVIEVDKELLRATSFKILTGTPSSNPKRPDLLNLQNIKQYRICDILIEKGQTSIEQRHITNAIGVETKFVTGILENISMDFLVDQWQDILNNFINVNTKSFNDWFDTVKDVLDENTAGNLLNMINDIQNEVNDIQNEVNNLPVYEKATQVDAEEGIDDTRYMTPIRTKEAIFKLSPSLEYKDVTNLSATVAGVITWGLQITTDQTRTAIVLCRATKDISNMDYASCLADSSVTKTNLGKDNVSNAYTGLANATKYWVKAFIQYTVGGENYYSNGNSVTFTTSSIFDVLNLTNSGEQFMWTVPSNSSHSNVEFCHSKTNITNFTFEQCQSDNSVTVTELAATAASNYILAYDKGVYYVKVFLKYTSQYSNGVDRSWYNPQYWLFRQGFNRGVRHYQGIGVVMGDGDIKLAGHEGWIIYEGSLAGLSSIKFQINSTTSVSPGAYGEILIGKNGGQGTLTTFTTNWNGVLSVGVGSPIGVRLYPPNTSTMHIYKIWGE